MNCVAQDSCDGHYTCNQNTGAKICLNGWSGPLCDIPDFTIVGCNNQDGNF